MILNELNPKLRLIEKMEILNVAIELAPVAKIGGLADVVLGLPLELKRQKHLVKIIIPKHKVLKTKQIKNLRVYKTVSCIFKKRIYQNTIYRGKVHGLDVYLVEDHTSFHLFNRKKIYGHKNDCQRFMYFCQVVIEFLKTEKTLPDILHLHDWHTSLLAYTYKTTFPRAHTKTILTVHNFAYQGVCPPCDFHHVGIPVIPKVFKDQKTKTQMNLLKGGLLLSDQIVTVSPTFAKEALKKIVDGRGLEPIVRKIKYKYQGILNGIDYTIWNPQKDPYLAKKIKSLSQITFKGWSQCKTTNKIDLQKSTKLAKNNKPLIACVTRLVPQKGLLLIRHAIQYTLKKGGQFVLLGSSANKRSMKSFQTLKRQIDHNPNCQIYLEHSERLVHKIFAGADFFIVPSKFEPCGITQMIALNFGTLPIVRKTGGLADTIHDVQDTSAHKKEKNGFVFVPFEKKGIEESIDRAFYLYEKKPKILDQLQKNALNQKFDWKSPSKQYLQVYKKTQ